MTSIQTCRSRAVSLRAAWTWVDRCVFSLCFFLVHRRQTHSGWEDLQPPSRPVPNLKRAILYSRCHSSETRHYLIAIYNYFMSIAHSFWHIRCLPPYLLGVHHGSRWNSAQSYTDAMMDELKLPRSTSQIVANTDETFIVIVMFFPTTRSVCIRAMDGTRARAIHRAVFATQRMKQYMKQFSTWCVLRGRPQNTMIILDCRKKGTRNKSLSPDDQEGPRNWTPYKEGTGTPFSFLITQVHLPVQIVSFF